MTHLNRSKTNPGSAPQTTNLSSSRQSIIYGCGCVPVVILALILGILTAIYFFGPGRTNIIIIGVDFTGEDSSVGRSDTNILTTVDPGKSFVGMLSIPRDLWVTIPDFGENRINTAHFFAEANQPGSGPSKVKETIRSNFGVDVDRFIRINFDGFRDVINAMGGVWVDLPEPMAGYEAGRHLLNGRKALAFARNRTNTDDFFRMNQGQILIKSVLKQVISPAGWLRLPGVASALPQAIDTDIPAWLWPRLVFTLLFVGPDGINNRVIDRNMVTPYVTDQGASVLLPIWERINPILLEMFGQ